MSEQIQSGIQNAPPPKITQRLAIQLGQKLTPPTSGHNLLLAFQFGGGPSRQDHPALISLQLQTLGYDAVFEAWWFEGDVNFTKFGSVRIAECQDYTVAIVQKEFTAPENFRQQTCQAYRELLNAVSSTEHRKLVKVWNYFGDINNGDDDFEKYRQFSIGRAEAFLDLGISDESAPTGTAIGTQGGSGLTLIALASNRQFCPVENPRQMSAFNYPKIYGPRSPKFSRGGFVSTKDHKLYLISGTASVVGHKSNFPHQTSLQLNETIKNLACLCDAISDKNQDELHFTLDEQSVLRIYLKDPQDYRKVAQQVNEKMKINERNIVFLQGTICREELMVEIDGVKVV